MSGSGLGKLILIGALIWILASGSPASASTQVQRGGGGGGSGSRGRDYPDYGATIPIARNDADSGIAEAHSQADDDWTQGASIYSAHRSDIDANPNPVPPPIVAVVMARESGGRDVTSTVGEMGPMQLSAAEVEAAGGGDPHNMRDAVRMAQIVYQRMIDMRPQNNQPDELFVALCSRSIGGGGCRWLLDHIGGDPSRARLVDRVQQWLAREPSKPERIAQSPRNWILRITRAMLRAQRAAREGFVSQAAGAHLARFGGRRSGTTPTADAGLTPAPDARSDGELTSRSDGGGTLPSEIRSPEGGSGTIPSGVRSPESSSASTPSGSTPSGDGGGRIPSGVRSPTSTGPSSSPATLTSTGTTATGTPSGSGDKLRPSSQVVPGLTRGGKVAS